MKNKNKNKKKLGLNESVLDGIIELIMEIFFFIIGALVLGVFGMNFQSSEFDWDLAVLAGLIAFFVLCFFVYFVRKQRVKRTKIKYKFDKSPVSVQFIKEKFRFLIESGYILSFYQRNSESEFIYSNKKCYFEIYLSGYKLDFIVKTGEFARVNLMESPLVDDNFRKVFFSSNNYERIDIIVRLIKFESRLFCLET